LYIITMAARHVPDGGVNITAEALPQRIGVQIHVTAQDVGPSSVDTNNAENLEMARELIQSLR
jgi:hypothetical protein